MFVLPGHGDGTFGDPESIWWDADTLPFDPGEPLVADVTGDGLPDVLVPGSGELHVLVNQRNETNHPPQSSRPPCTAVVRLPLARAGQLRLPHAAVGLSAVDPDQHALLLEFEVRASRPTSPA